MGFLRVDAFHFMIIYATLSASLSTAATIDPVPKPDLAAIFIEGAPSFDPTTHIFSASGPISAVQFPGMIISTEDPLVLAGAVMTMTSVFTGTALSPLSAVDTTADFINSTTTITVNGSVVYSSFTSQMTFSAFFDTPTGVIGDWSATTASTEAFDLSVIDSPFLSVYANPLDGSKPPVKTTTIKWDPTGKNPTESNDDKEPFSTVPEPGAVAQLFGAAALAASIRLLQRVSCRRDSLYQIRLLRWGREKF